jgi:ligand-binding sensor domain-containing protein
MKMMKNLYIVLFALLLANFTKAQPWTTYTTADGLVDNAIYSIGIDAQNNKWFGGVCGGISKYDGSNWTNYTSVNGNDLTTTVVFCVSVDVSGNRWFGSDYGATKYDGTTWTTYTVISGLPQQQVIDIAFDASGNKWFATHGGISMYNGTSFTNYTTSNGLPYELTDAIAIDGTGIKWIGNGFFDYAFVKFDGTTWTTYTIANGLVNDVVTCIAVDASNNKWIGTQGGVSKFNGTSFTNYTTWEGLPGNFINDIKIDLTGNVWVATDAGVAKYNGSVWTAYTINDGLVSNYVFSVGVDNQNNKWFGTDSGVSKLTESQLSIPTVSTNTITNVASASATSGGNVTSNGGLNVTVKGVCWSTSTNPTIAGSHTTDGSGTGTFTSNLTGLNPGITYYVRAYATNSAGTAYGNQQTFTTVANLPILSTTSISGTTSSSASSGGNITSDGGSSITARGVCWSTSSSPTTSNSHTTNGTGSGTFTSNITGLTPGTLYYVRAYATNSAGTSYGNQLSFTTLAVLPTLTTTTISGITTTTASGGGNITSNGGGTITARGLCWSTSPSPTTSNFTTNDGAGTGSFTSNLTGLNPGITYYVRAYATNSAGTAYGNEVNFTTLSVYLATLTTTAATAITGSNATSGGNITSDGGGTITVRGVCWATSVNPTTSNTHSTDGTGTGTFTSNLTGLTPGTTYHARAYATNSAGTAYGNDIYFTILAIPSVTTTAISNITTSSAYGGGMVVNNGGSSVTARGICWSTNANPDLSCTFTIDGSGNGNFTSSLTGLSQNTVYHVRAYATNANGTGYGNDVTFKTSMPSSTEVYLTNIAFVSLQQEPSLPNIPTTMTMGSSNPENFVNPGMKVRFKMECFNYKSSGLSIVSGLCKVRTYDPSLVLTDSTSGLNNVGWNQAAWSTDEFEVSVPSSAQFGHVYYVDFVVIENGNEYFTYNVPIPIAPLALHSRTVDDDGNPDSQGNGNGLCDPGEIVESFPTLDNVSTMAASTNRGIYENYYGYPDISVWNNHTGISGNVVNECYWNYCFGAPQVINPGDTCMGPEFDFVFNYNYSQIYHFQLALKMSGTFQVFTNKQAYMRWLVPIDYNSGYNDAPIGIEENTFYKNFLVYPNPVINELIIEFDGNTKKACFEILNSIGQVVFKGNLNEKTIVNTSNFAPGFYLIKLGNGKTFEFKKIIKE